MHEFLIIPHMATSVIFVSQPIPSERFVSCGYGRNCCVAWCNNNGRTRTRPGTKFFRIPQDGRHVVVSFSPYFNNLRKAQSSLKVEKWEVKRLFTTHFITAKNPVPDVIQNIPFHRNCNNVGTTIAHQPRKAFSITSYSRAVLSARIGNSRGSWFYHQCCWGVWRSWSAIPGEPVRSPTKTAVSFPLQTQQVYSLPGNCTQDT